MLVPVLLLEILPLLQGLLHCLISIRAALDIPPRHRALQPTMPRSGDDVAPSASFPNISPVPAEWGITVMC
jgi:hypothetical protein